MAAPAGIAGQFGFKSETTYGTAVTPDLFPPGFVSESIKREQERIESAGLRAGRMTTHSWCDGPISVSGPINLELWNDIVATLLTHMFGDVQTAGAGPFVHTATPGDLTGKSFTAQVGRPDIGGTVRPFTYPGCKLSGWTLAASVGEIATLELDVVAQSEDTGTALAAASYPVGASPFCFVAGSLDIDGTPIATIQDMSLEADNGLSTDRHRMGGATIREPLQNGMRAYTGQLTADFEDLTAYNRFVNGTVVAQVMTFDNGTDTLVVTTNTRYDGQTPEVAGPEQLNQVLPYKAVGGATDAAAITAVLTNGEASAA